MKPRDKAIDDLLDYAQAYASMGWHMLAVHRDSKLPISPKGVKNASDNELVLKSWFEDGDHNIAIACGLSSIGVLDVDPRHGGDIRLEKLESKHGQLPDTLTADTGGGGQHYVFRVPEGYKIQHRLGKEYAETGEETGLDGLNGNKYFVVEPSIHYKTGEPYQWRDWDILSDKPQEILDAIEDAPEWILEKEQDVQLNETATILNTSGFLPPERIADLRSALSFILCEDYHVWLQVGQALHSTEAANAFGIWDEWSQKSDKYNPGEMRKKWMSFGNNRGLNVESIFTWAEEYGWANPAKYQAQDQAELQALIGEKSSIQKFEAIELQAPTFKPLPIKELNELASWFNQQLGSYHLQATQAAVISLACLMASRRYRTPGHQSANTYIAVTAETVGYIQPLKVLSQNFLSEIDRQRFIRASRINTEQVLTRALMRSPVLHYIADDYGQMLNLANRQPSGVIQHVLTDLVEVYAQETRFVDDDQGLRKGEEILPIHNPGLNLLAMISEENTPAMCNSRELGRGSLAQFIMVDAGELIINSDPQRFAVPASVTEKAHRLQPADITGSMETLTGSVLPIDPLVMKYAPQVKDIVIQYERDFKALIADNRLYPLATGARVSLHRLLLTMAAWQNPESPTATQEIAEWAGWYVKQWLERLLNRLSLIFSEGDEKPDAYQKVLERIAKSGPEGIKERELRNSCKPFRSLSQEKRAELIAILLDDEAIREISTTGKNGQKGKKYVYAPLTKKVDQE